MKKTLIGFALSTLISGAHAQALNSFEEITQQLSNGNEINAVVNLSECKITDPNAVKMPVANWFVKPRTVVFTDKMIAMDGEKYTHGRDPLPKSGLMQRGTINLDNTEHASIIVSFFDAESNQKALMDVSIHCQLNNGLKIFTR